MMSGMKEIEDIGISIIIIGQNEGWKLTKCLQSVYNTIEYNKLSSYEVIYVDSKSTDDSIQRAIEFTGIKIFKINGECNAAIARNIGAAESKGEVLFFIDGDIELLPDFLSHVLDNDKESLKYECVAGYIDNIYYNRFNKFIGREPVGYKKNLPAKEIKKSFIGGIFLIKRAYWDMVNGMRTKYKKNEDLDLSFRLANRGILFTRIPFLMGLHHTIDYRNEDRMWGILFSGDLCYPSVMARDHLFNAAKLRHTFRRQYTAILMLLSFISLVVNYVVFVIIFSFYLITFLAKVFTNTLNAAINSKNKVLYYFKRLIFQLFSDILFWIGFFFFYPNEKELSYIKIQ